MGHPNSVTVAILCHCRRGHCGVWMVFTCGFQDAGLGATGSQLNLLTKTKRKHKTTSLTTESWQSGVIVHEKVNG